MKKHAFYLSAFLSGIVGLVLNVAGRAMHSLQSTALVFTLAGVVCTLFALLRQERGWYSVLIGLVLANVIALMML